MSRDKVTGASGKCFRRMYDWNRGRALPLAPTKTEGGTKIRGHITSFGDSMGCHCEEPLNKSSKGPSSSSEA